MPILIKKKLTFAEKRERLGYKRIENTNRISRPKFEKTTLEEQKINEEKRLFALKQRQIKAWSKIANSKLKELNPKMSVKSLKDHVVEEVYPKIKRYPGYKEINPRFLKAAIEGFFYIEFQKTIVPTKLKNMNAREIYNKILSVSEITKNKFRKYY